MEQLEPEREYYTIKALAKYWGCSKDYVRHCLETYKSNNERMLDGEYKEDSYTGKWLSPDNEEKVRRLVIHPFPSGRFPCGKVVIMQKEVKRFEDENGKPNAASNESDNTLVGQPTQENPLFNPMVFLENGISEGKSKDAIIVELVENHGSKREKFYGTIARWLFPNNEYPSNASWRSAGFRAYKTAKKKLST